MLQFLYTLTLLLHKVFRNTSVLQLNFARKVGKSGDGGEVGPEFPGRLERLGKLGRPGRPGRLGRPGKRLVKTSWEGAGSEPGSWEPSIEKSEEESGSWPDLETLELLELLEPDTRKLFPKTGAGSIKKAS